MTQIEAPKVVKKKLFSPIWLLPLVALALGAWIGVKSIKEAGIEVRIHFPSATGIDVGKTLVRYQGVTVGKVVDVSIDNVLNGVNVDLKMDYRAAPYLNKGTKFWLVTPKASITGVEGLDTLFSGNYIAIQPGKGEPQSFFDAEKNAPAIIPNEDGLIVELTSKTLGSLSVGSKLFYRQIPVGQIISYQLEGAKQISLTAFVQKQYAHLVKKDSLFWNVSGLKIDASLSGIKIKTESLSTILAGGLSFSSSENSEVAEKGQRYELYDNEELALEGISFTLTADKAASASVGTAIVFRGINIGKITQSRLTASGVEFSAKLMTEHADLLSATSYFWLEGADLSLSGVKHAERLLTGSVINFSPGAGKPLSHYPLLSQQPDQLAQTKLRLTLTSESNHGISEGAEVRYKQMAIGHITSVKLNTSLSGIVYQTEILPEFTQLITKGSYFTPESALSIDASLDGVSVTTRDLSTLTNGAISLIQGQSKSVVNKGTELTLFASEQAAKQHFNNLNLTRLSLNSPDGASLSSGSPVYYQKMQIGQVSSVTWQAKGETFAINLSIQQQFSSLLKPNAVFWRNSAMSISAAITGIDIDVAPLQGALKGSITLGLLDNDDDVGNQTYLYASKSLALAQAKPIILSFPADVKLAAKAPIRYQGHQVGEIETVKLDDDLNSVTVKAYIYGSYAAHFTQRDAHYFIVDAQISLSGITSPETLLTGPYVGVIPGNDVETSKYFIGKMTPLKLAKSGELLFTLKDSTLGSIKSGTQIYFRGIKVGQVDSYDLSDTGNSVLINSHIDSKYSHLVNTTSQFWDLSGVKVDIGLFSGAKIETGTLETILAGGIGVVTEASTTSTNQLSPSTQFILQKQFVPEWLSWSPIQIAP
jgi:paraquat-inducible protein B